MGNASDSAGCAVTFAAAWLCWCSTKAAVDNKKMHEHGCVLIKFYSQMPAGQIWPMAGVGEVQFIAQVFLVLLCLTKITW